MRLSLVIASAVVFSLGCARPTEGPVLSSIVIGHCAYTGQFSRMNECKDYLGAWESAAAEKDCADMKGAYEGGSVCNPPASLGMCLIAAKPEQTRTYIASDNTSKCASARTGCEVFGGGFWQPSSLCGGANDELVVLENPWRQPERICKDDGQGGQLCVLNGIHGATREGRSFREDAVCANSMSGRPYYAKDPNPKWTQPDPRRSDPTYLAEEAWVKSQINAASCVCCHSSAAPNGAAAIFDIDREGSLANQLTDRGIAHGSGLVNSIPLGALPADQNNGFAKSDLEHPDYSIFLSTDPARMKRFWQGEEAYRGLTAADFVGVPDGFGPLSEQLYFQPQACEGGEGVAADGTITWGKGRARYVYVLTKGSSSPTVWPNLDTPPGTLWRLDVPADGTPLASGSVKYGVAAEGTTQHFPVAGAPTALTSGTEYYLYVSADQMLPITRCIFTAP